MKKIIALLILLAMIFSLIPIGSIVANATTLTVTFSTTICANNVGTINIMKSTLVADREYEYAFYDANNNILSHSIADNRQWFGLKFSAPNTNYGSVQIDNTQSWYSMKQFGNGSGFFILPLTYHFLGATKLEIREKATPANTSGIISIDTSKIATGAPGGTPFGGSSPISAIPGAIQLQTNASRYEAGVVYYYVAGTTNAKLSVDTVKQNGGMFMVKGNSGVNNDTDVYLTDPSASYYNFYCPTKDDTAVFSCTGATFNSLTPATPNLSIAAGSIAETFVINGLLPYTYEYVQTASATPPASWTGAATVMNGQGTSSNITRTSDYLHIRVKAGTRITNPSSSQAISLASIPMVRDVTVTENANAMYVLTSAGGQVTFDVTFAGSWDVSKPVSLSFVEDESWLSTSTSPASRTSDGSIAVTFTASSNSTYLMREELVTVNVTAETGIYEFSQSSFTVLIKQGGIAVGDPPAFPDGYAEQGTVSGATTVIFDAPGGLYTYGFSTDSDEENVTSWSGFVTADNFVDLVVPHGGITYIFIKAIDQALRESPANAINLMGCVKTPSRPTGVIKVNNGASPNENFIYPMPYALMTFIYEEGQFDVGYTYSATSEDVGDEVTWIQFDKYFSGNNTTQGALYLGWNCRYAVYRYSADGAIPASEPKYSLNVIYDYHDWDKYPNDNRYLDMDTGLGKYDFVATETGYEFTPETTFLPYMRYVVFVDDDLSSHTTFSSPSRYNFVGGGWCEGRGELFGDYARAKMSGSNVFYTDVNGKPWADSDFTQPFETAITGSAGQYVYIAPTNESNVVDGTTYVYYCYIYTTPYNNTIPEYGGSGASGTNCRNVVQRYLLSSLPPL